MRNQRLIIAMNPRLPRGVQLIKFQLEDQDQLQKDQIQWFLNGEEVEGQWPITLRKYKLTAKVRLDGYNQWSRSEVLFTVVE